MSLALSAFRRATIPLLALKKMSSGADLTSTPPGPVREVPRAAAATLMRLRLTGAVVFPLEALPDAAGRDGAPADCDRRGKASRAGCGSWSCTQENEHVDVKQL